MKIKIMTIEDFESIYALWKEASLDVGNIKCEKNSTDQIIKLNLLSNLVAFEGNKVVSSVFGVFNGRRGWVYHLAVHPSFHLPMPKCFDLPKQSKTYEKR